MILKRLGFLLKVVFLSFNYIIGTFEQCNTDVPFYNENFLVLETLNGKVRGSCNRIEINDPNNPNMTDYIISWKSNIEV